MSQPPKHPYIPGAPYGSSFGRDPRNPPPGGWPTGAYDPTAQIRWRLKWLRLVTWVVLPLCCLGFVWVAAVIETHPHYHNPFGAAAPKWVNSGAAPVVAAVVIFLIIVLCASKIRKTKRELRAAAKPPAGVISPPPGWQPGQR
jgi:hypothetical protein